MMTFSHLSFLNKRVCADKRWAEMMKLQEFLLTYHHHYHFVWFVLTFVVADINLSLFYLQLLC